MDREKRDRRHSKIRSRIKGDSKRPRLCVFRSANHIYASLIDDEKHITLASVSDLKTKSKKAKTILAQEVGKKIAAAASEKKINNVVFDRGGYKYHGRVKAVADGAREGGLKF